MDSYSTYWHSTWEVNKQLLIELLMFENEIYLTPQAISNFYRYMKVLILNYDLL